MLREAGWDCTVVDNGRQAVEAVRDARSDAFDLVLMDCQMPELDGFGATGEIRALEAAAGRLRLPIVALTANAVQGDRERCLDAGMDGYVTKPIDCIRLLAEIDRATRGRRRSKPAKPAPVVPVETPPAPARRPRPPEREPIDLPSLLQRCGGRSELAARLLAAFAAQLPGQVAAVQDAADDPTQLARAAHALKGTAANLSALPLAEAAAAVEAALAGGATGPELDTLAREADRAAARSNPLAAELRALPAPAALAA